ncbi:LexA family transcriptional regulator [Lysinibacillus fusiformis]|uniref:LexA family transcriptional regulator n=1 Tax=Lysinibacillus fusiformis TaxID=28031 RepID=UPI000D3B93D4|nr:LexA family transcriptional regulator [Lysinibacillus fusiformis]MED4672368.1 LexA family transcriptional regulator [Lysinibacillus fusiformis]RDV32235.1 hypothetical protein C7B90_10955 [Lysinibacillus fusiformis]GED65591.1 hypothetical protein LFU01_40430 [Lysinibacillus fusiformis]
MNYADLLSKYIYESSMSLGEISIQMKEKNHPIDRSYISKLKNGTRPPASEKVNRALAEVLGGDPDKLITAGYLEKAPKEVQELISNYVDKIDTYTAIIAMFCAEPEQLKQVKDIYENLKNLTIEDRLDFITNKFNRMIVDRPDIPKDLSLYTRTLNDSFKKIYTEKPLSRIEVWDTIKNEAYHEWIAANKIPFGKYIYLIYNDDSMINIKINKGSKVLIKIIETKLGESDNLNNIESGKLYALIYQDNVYIRRVFLQRDALTLQAENSEIHPLIINDLKDIELIGMVISAEFDPNE